MPEIIEKNPKVLGGQPVIRGTRIPVSRIVALHIQGYRLKDFRKDYPYLDLNRKDLLAIFTFYQEQLAKY
ncbi:hypothetical protein A3F34_02335 [Candidatus Roizmanbacteria bacterium RIFCSPHIGHO2_12_FULL_44_10]|uniref:Antitoxin n=1 Tax=Candidatus Roizmanbacteria bacterium RIFCSPHIGHO2_12_FULL_44_10 TaxID=1802054 RepID=A0A1F7I9B7_9BACT|nr:MAG: hypothetical protein A3F34_02335 [Candidatus Roizmanbacteria bacterium RIFCSPHIGHO2_12_FULL_44_10]